MVESDGLAVHRLAARRRNHSGLDCANWHLLVRLRALSSRPHISAAALAADAERFGDQSCDLILALRASSISREHIAVPAAKSSGSRPPWQRGQHTAILPHARSSSLVARRRADDFIASSAAIILCRASRSICSNLRVKIRKASKLSMVRSQSSHQTRRSDGL